MPPGSEEPGVIPGVPEFPGNAYRAPDNRSWSVLGQTAGCAGPRPVCQEIRPPLRESSPVLPPRARQGDFQ